MFHFQVLYVVLVSFVNVTYMVRATMCRCLCLVSMNNHPLLTLPQWCWLAFWLGDSLQLKEFICFFIYLDICLYVSVCACVWRCLYPCIERPEEVLGSLRVGVAGAWGMPGLWLECWDLNYDCVSSVFNCCAPFPVPVFITDTMIVLLSYDLPFNSLYWKHFQ